MTNSDDQTAMAQAQEELASTKRDSAYFALAPFTDGEKKELVTMLLNTEKLRIEAANTVMRAQQAERSFNTRYVDLAKAHGVTLPDEPFLPSSPEPAIRLVSGPNCDPAIEADSRGCQKIHSCIACDTVCCYAWECGKCEGCDQCTIGT
jgi:hypothetical protein